jgi:methionine--tRNA ligase beta chain
LITLEEFKRVELRVAEVTAVERVAGTDRLLRLEADVGDGRRTMVAGLAPQYSPEDLIGQKIVVVANLEPATVRGIRSEGMLLAAIDASGDIALLTVNRDIANGAAVE